MFRTDFNKNSNADSHGVLLFYHEILHHGCFEKVIGTDVCIIYIIYVNVFVHKELLILYPTDRFTYIHDYFN